MQALEPFDWVFQHGWGFDSSMWSGWTEALPQPLLLDRGYFGREHKGAQPSGKRPLIAAAHSLGLHLMPTALLAASDLLVILSGFLSFLPKSGSLRSLYLRNLGSLSRLVDEKKKEGLAFFHEMVFSPKPVPSYLSDTFFTIIDWKKLADDLQLLRKQEPAFSGHLKDKPILIIQGTADRVVLPQKAKELQRELPKSKLLLLADQSHAMALTAPGECLSAIEHWVKNL